MFVEIHLLQNFAPSNLNRDDTGAPKDCEFGGYRRARISSQAIKRAVRNSFKSGELLPPEALGTRTKRLRAELVDRLTKQGKSEEDADKVSAAAITSTGLRFDRNGELTQYLLFLGEEEVNRFAALCLEHWDELVGGKEMKGKGNPFVSLLDGGKAADVALFGRMLADLPERNVDAASQVAHAISTNRVSMEFDFYTAVDDLNPEDTEGAGMLGTVEFNSACFYRYANVDLDQLLNNLGGDEELVCRTLAAYLEALKDAVPTGKQNSMAAQNPPSFVFVVARERGLWSLANAFLKPVAASQRGGDLMELSQKALADYWYKLTKMYGPDGISGAWWVALDEEDLAERLGAPSDSFAALAESVVAAARFGSNGAGSAA